MESRDDGVENIHKLLITRGGWLCVGSNDGSNRDFWLEATDSRTSNEGVRSTDEVNASISKSDENDEHSERRKNGVGYDEPLCHGQEPLPFSALKELVAKEPDEILSEVGKNDRFESLLEAEDLDRDRTALVIIALGKIGSSDSRDTFLTAFTGKTHFLESSIPKFLASLSVDSVEDHHLESLSYLATLVKRVQSSSPSLATGAVSALLPSLREKCETLLGGSVLYDGVMQKLKNIEEQNEYYGGIIHSGNGTLSRKQALRFAEPPENFRTLSIVPDVGDIISMDPFLRPNIVEGRYLDAEHYLDVQFRLLREDYIKSLRDGVGEYVSKRLKGKPGTNCKAARVYLDARIVKAEFEKGTMYHLVKIPTASFPSKVWPSDKCFLARSLLCLSSDDFETMMFASVARRDPERLKKGLLSIQFEEISEEILNISPKTNFVIIESLAYFEAYRHNLKALQELDENTIPLKEYIIDVQRDVKPPRYLDNFTTYDLRPLLVPVDSAHIKCEMTEWGTRSFRYEFPEDCRVGESVEVLDDRSWPCASDLKFESSQYLALKAALTREFALIQGPPGTGKTYVGLRIVQILLHNIDKWFRKETHSLPILVVCLTNHALDQFLEKMVTFTDKIVRVGKQGKNDAIHPFQLKNLKNLPNYRQEIPEHIRSTLFRQSQEVRRLERDIDELNSLLRKCTNRVMSEKHLSRYIPHNQFLSLKNLMYCEEFSGMTDDDFIIRDWLHVPPRLGWKDFAEFSIGTWNPEGENFFFSDSNYEPAMGKVYKEIGGRYAEDFADFPIGIWNPEEERFPLSATNSDKLAYAIERIDDDESAEDTDEEDFADFPIGTWNPEEEFSLWDNTVQGGRKQRSEYIKNWLNKSKALEETEALRISNVWDLDLVRRWSLYKYWLEKFVTRTQELRLKLQAQLKLEYQELLETKTEEDFHVLKRVHVVGMTTTGAAKYRNIVRRLNPQILVVEEAAEILESHIMTALAPNTQHVILIGDHQQLRPSPNVHKLAVKYDANVSLFERMVRNKMECVKLSMQHRMRPDITDLIVPHIYSELENHSSVAKYENIKGVAKNVYFVAHDCHEKRERDAHSKCNVHEATFIIRLCNYFIQQGYDSSQITVLTTYNRQLSLMKETAEEFPMVKNVRFTVVDSYQGEENDIILISLVRSNSDGEIGFLNVANRVCVALSRARKGLYCIGDFELLSEKSNLWRSITETLKQKGAIGKSLPLSCQNHSSVYVEVSEAKDFDSIPEGGCTQKCDYRFSCGHVCPLKCHIYDRDHLNIVCVKKCDRKCEEGHICPKICSQKCGPCEFPVSYEAHPCGHTVPCFKKHLYASCAEKCPKKFICGHTCPKKCGEICAEACTEFILVEFPVCGHVVDLECRLFTSSRELICCNFPCDAVLECGHRCDGNCTDCHQGRLHVACHQPCERTLVCGHPCKSPCAKSCPPCELPCENRCVHSKCSRPCGEPCNVCTEKCEWYCEHHRCSRSCGELCNRDPCNEACGLSLKCGHPCIGFCGEPCPEQCRICHSEVVKEIFFGTEEEDDARFVRLEDCHHVLEVSGLDEWMRSENESYGSIRMKACPKCDTVIRANLRFGNVVKDCLKKIEKVKERTFGDADNNKRSRERLLKKLEEERIFLIILTSGLFSVYDYWKRIFASESCRSTQEIASVESFIRISLQLCRLNLNDWLYPRIQQVHPVEKDIYYVINFIEVTTSWLVKFLLNGSLDASGQQLEQFSWEVHRLTLSGAFLDFIRDRSIQLPSPHFENCIRILTNQVPFREDSVKEFSDSYRALVETFRSPAINVLDMEKDLILKPVDLCVGHWYQCPNDHVYCITESVRVLGESMCYECNASMTFERE